MKLRRPKSCTWSTATTTDEKVPDVLRLPRQKWRIPWLRTSPVHARISSSVSARGSFARPCTSSPTFSILYTSFYASSLYSALSVPHMISVQCLCTQVNTDNADVIGTPNQPFPNPNAAWSVRSSFVRKWTWTLVAPQPQRHMISVQCLCAQVNMNACGTPTPTPHDQRAVPVCASEHERLWHPNPNATWSVCSACVCGSEHEHCWHPTPPLWSPVCIEYCVHRCGKNGKKWYKTLWAQMNQLFAHSFINLLYLLRLPRQRTQLQKRTERRWEMVRTYLHKNALQDQFSRDHSLKRRIKELLWAKSTRRHEPLVNPALALTVVGHTSCLVVAGS